MKPNSLSEATLACEASSSLWMSEIVDSEDFSLEFCSSKVSIFWESCKISASFSERAASFSAMTCRNFEFEFSRPETLSSRRARSASSWPFFCCSCKRSLLSAQKFNFENQRSVWDGIFLGHKVSFPDFCITIVRFRVCLVG